MLSLSHHLNHTQRRINMSVQIALEFTDGQWALIQEHHPYIDGVAITAESLGTALTDRLKDDITRIIKRNAAHAQQDAMEV